MSQRVRQPTGHRGLWNVPGHRPGLWNVRPRRDVTRGAFDREAYVESPQPSYSRRPSRRRHMSGDRWRRRPWSFIGIFYSFWKVIGSFRNLSALTTKHRDHGDRRGPRRLRSNRTAVRPTGVAHGRLQTTAHAAAVGQTIGVFFNFINDLKCRNCRHEMCVSKSYEIL
jgi:hypothetical protein